MHSVACLQRACALDGTHTDVQPTDVHKNVCVHVFVANKREVLFGLLWQFVHQAAIDDGMYCMHVIKGTNSEEDKTKFMRISPQKKENTISAP